MQTRAQVMTASGQTYLRKLCRHFAHKVPATLNGDQGIIDFPFGRCRIDATPDQLHLFIDIEDVNDLNSAEQVITDHLLRVANGDDLKVQWSRTTQ